MFWKDICPVIFGPGHIYSKAQSHHFETYLNPNTQACFSKSSLGTLPLHNPTFVDISFILVLFVLLSFSTLSGYFYFYTFYIFILYLRYS